MRALVIVGHGSHLNADSSLPVYEHAQRIRETGEFDEVVECFWKEEPSMRHVLDTVESEDVYVVPAFISEGYFTQQVIPQRARPGGAPQQKGRRRPSATRVLLGTFEGMPDVILERTDDLMRGKRGLGPHGPRPARPRHRPEQELGWRHLPQRGAHQGAGHLRPRRGRVPGPGARDRRRRRQRRGGERDPDPRVHRGGLAHPRDDPR